MLYSPGLMVIIITMLWESAICVHLKQHDYTIAVRILIFSLIFYLLVMLESVFFFKFSDYELSMVICEIF